MENGNRKFNLYEPIFAKIGEPTNEIPEGKRYLELDEIPFTEIINLLEKFIDLVGEEYGKGGWVEIEGEVIEPLIIKAKEILKILI